MATTFTRTLRNLPDLQVIRLDRRPPTLTTRGRPSTVSDLGGGRYGLFITPRHLRASDGDSPAAAVEFTITGPPRFGYLENVHTGEAPCSAWLVVLAAGQCQTSVYQERPSGGASRSGTWTAAPSPTSSRRTWRSPTTASCSASPIRRETRHHLSCGFVGRVQVSRACPLVSSAAVSVLQPGPVLVAGPAGRRLLQDL